MSRGVFIWVLSILISSAIFVSLKNTVKWAGDFSGLLVLMSIDDEIYSMNPFSQDFFWIGSDLAENILLNREYPYTRCVNQTLLDNCNEPRISQAMNFIWGVDSVSDERFYRLIDFLIARGDPIDEYSSFGMTALHSAVLFNNPRLLRTLLKNDADPFLKIRGLSKSKGLNAIEFVQNLYIKNPNRFGQLAKVMQEFSPNKAKNLHSLRSLGRGKPRPF